jgi:hypothetical protein
MNINSMRFHLRKDEAMSYINPKAVVAPPEPQSFHVRMRHRSSPLRRTLRLLTPSMGDCCIAAVLLDSSIDELWTEFDHYL